MPVSGNCNKCAFGCGILNKGAFSKKRVSNKLNNEFNIIYKLLAAKKIYSIVSAA